MNGEWDGFLRSASGADTAVRVAAPSVEWTALLPLLILLVGGLVLLTVSSFLRTRVGRNFYPWATVILAVASAVSVVPVWARVQGWNAIMWIDVSHARTGPFSTIAGAVGVDGFGLFITVVLCVGVALAALLAPSYLRQEQMEGPAFYVLVLLSASGGVIMAMANDLIVLFIGLETLSIAVYVLTGMNLRRAESQESGLKYFVLGGFSSAFLLYGIAMLYGATGSTNFIAIKDFMAAVVPVHDGLLLMGLALVLLGLAFKIGAVPFHTWSPDVYDGAPAPSVVWMSAGVKVAAAAGFVRVFVLAFSNYADTWKPMIYAIAVLSMVIGAALAIVQSNVKRMLAYSSIAQAGFILVGVVAVSPEGTSSALFYLVAYGFTTIGAFAVISLVRDASGEATQISAWAGLGRRSPLVAGAFAVFMLALAGIPLTSGFIGKFGVFAAAIEAGATWLVIVGVVASLIAAFFYVRVIVVMFFREPGPETASVVVPSAFTTVALTAGATVTVLLGIVPQPLLELVGNADLFIR